MQLTHINNVSVAKVGSCVPHQQVRLYGVMAIDQDVNAPGEFCSNVFLSESK